MKTTVEIPDSLYRQVKAQAAARGQTVKAFLLEALHLQLAGRTADSQVESGWRLVFGKANAAAIDELQRRLDTEFSQVRPDEWQ